MSRILPLGLQNSTPCLSACTMHSVPREQHPCTSDTGRWFRQFLVIYRCLDKGGGGGLAAAVVAAASTIAHRSQCAVEYQGQGVPRVRVSSATRVCRVLGLRGPSVVEAPDLDWAHTPCATSPPPPEGDHHLPLIPEGDHDCPIAPLIARSIFSASAMP